MDRGYQYYPGGIDSGSAPVDFKSSKGVLHGQPMPLDGKGDRLADKASPVFLDIESIPSADFNNLRIFPGQ